MENETNIKKLNKTITATSKQIEVLQKDNKSLLRNFEDIITSLILHKNILINFSKEEAVKAISQNNNNNNNNSYDCNIPDLLSNLLIKKTENDQLTDNFLHLIKRKEELSKTYSQLTISIEFKTKQKLLLEKHYQQDNRKLETKVFEKKRELEKKVKEHDTYITTHNILMRYEVYITPPNSINIELYNEKIQTLEINDKVALLVKEEKRKFQEQQALIVSLSKEIERARRSKGSVSVFYDNDDNNNTDNDNNNINNYNSVLVEKNKGYSSLGGNYNCLGNSGANSAVNKNINSNVNSNINSNNVGNYSTNAYNTNINYKDNYNTNIANNYATNTKNKSFIPQAETEVEHANNQEYSNNNNNNNNFCSNNYNTNKNKVFIFNNNNNNIKMIQEEDYNKNLNNSDNSNISGTDNNKSEQIDLNDFNIDQTLNSQYINFPDKVKMNQPRIPFNFNITKKSKLSNNNSNCNMDINIKHTNTQNYNTNTNMTPLSLMNHININTTNTNNKSQINNNNNDNNNNIDSCYANYNTNINLAIPKLNFTPILNKYNNDKSVVIKEAKENLTKDNKDNKDTKDTKDNKNNNSKLTPSNSKGVSKYNKKEEKKLLSLLEKDKVSKTNEEIELEQHIEDADILILELEDTLNIVKEKFRNYNKNNSVLKQELFDRECKIEELMRLLKDEEEEANNNNDNYNENQDNDHDDIINNNIEVKSDLISKDYNTNNNEDDNDIEDDDYYSGDLDDLNYDVFDNNLEVKISNSNIVDNFRKNLQLHQLNK